MGIRVGFLRLQGIPDAYAGQNPVANLLSHAGRFVQGGEQAQSDGPYRPTEQDAFAIPARPVHHETGHGTADGCKRSARGGAKWKELDLLCIRVMGSNIAPAWTVEYSKTSW